MKGRGRFYFKRTTNGNLIGEWSNISEIRTFSESADLNGPNSGTFHGQYDSSWQEGGVAIHANLTIKPKNGGPLFKLEWRGGDVIFDGEGMLCDDMLIGDYHRPS